MSCKEIELTTYFIEKDKEYIKNDKYAIVKPGYINKTRLW